ncbi:hypothetical protein EW026_g8292 [Hermanssonia centrifuga]|uniref:Uncharacterized protein n=1 Tax=Hermanssonia centrifuga TaxID=98765 RepID=A0A4S4K4Q9_9APHY|nr:hypothetical protein EW026_g8292 [Hermanssonia centrifuga]
MTANSDDAYYDLPPLTEAELHDENPPVNDPLMDAYISNYILKRSSGPPLSEYRFFADALLVFIDHCQVRNLLHPNDLLSCLAVLATYHELSGPMVAAVLPYDVVPPNMVSISPP